MQEILSNIFYKFVTFILKFNYYEQPVKENSSKDDTTQKLTDNSDV